MSMSTELPTQWDKVADVVVIGFGATGAAAAIEAHDTGAKVLILEKMPAPGGNTIISGGRVMGANTSVQKTRGIEDSAAEAYEYLSARAEGYADGDKLKLIAESSGGNIEWLIKQGVDFPPDLLVIGSVEEIPRYAEITPPRARTHVPATLDGTGLMRPLEKAVKERGIEVMVQAAAKELIIHPVAGAVVGVKTEKLSIKARRGIVLATGGYGDNPEMVMNYNRSYTIRCFSYVARGLTGDGIRMGQALGADLRNMGAMTLMVVGTPVASPYTDLTPFVMFQMPISQIVVNKKGVRFVNETLPFIELGAILMEQEDSIGFLIFDEAHMRLGGRIIALPPLSPDLSKELAERTMKKAQTIGELAQAIGVDADTLEDTVYAYNENAEKGVDPGFGRRSSLAPINTAPFYAVELRPIFCETGGGLKVNKDFQVIDVFGKAIRRLYAGGATTGGLQGAYYATAGYLLAYCLMSGRIAGKHAAMERIWD